MATDVTPAPSTVEKLATAFGAELYRPNSNLATDEKEQLVGGFETDEIDIHAQDALAAAVKAFNDHKHFLQRVQRQAEEAGIDDVEAVIKKSFLGPQSIQQAIDAVQPDETETDDTQEPSEERSAQQVNWEEKAAEYREQLKKREQENKRLRNYVEELKDDMQELQEEKEQLETEQRRKIQQQEEVQRWKTKAENSRKQARRLQDDRKELQSRIEQYQQLVDSIHSGDYLFRICNSGDELAAVEGEIAFVARNVHAEVPSNVTMVIVEKPGDAEFYAEEGIHTLRIGELNGVRADNFYAGDRKTIKEKARTEQDKFMDWLDDYRDRDD